MNAEQEAPRTYAQAFAISATGCPAQWLIVDGSSFDRRIDDDAWIKGIAIGPAGAAS